MFQLIVHQTLLSCPRVVLQVYHVFLQLPISNALFVIIILWHFLVGVVQLARSGSSSTSYSSGRVQIYYNNQWGNICDDTQFGITEAHVICHQLGYTGASSQSKQLYDR